MVHNNILNTLKKTKTKGMKVLIITLVVVVVSVILYDKSVKK